MQDQKQEIKNLKLVIGRLLRENGELRVQLSGRMHFTFMVDMIAVGGLSFLLGFASEVAIQYLTNTL